MTKEQKKQLFGFGLPIILGTILLLSASYAWLQLTLDGTKTNVLKVGDLSLELDDTNGVAINGDGVLPVLDAVGLEEDPYTFKLIKGGTTASKYTIYLDNVSLEEGETQLPDDAIKFDLKKDDTTLIRTLLSYVTEEDHDRVLDTGVIKGGETFSYDLRMWVDQDATSTMAAGKTFRGKIRVEAEQVVEHAPTPEECFEFDGKGAITKYLCGPTFREGYEEVTKDNTVENSPAGRFITDVVIPETIGGIPVKAIKGTTTPPRDSFAFTGITSVIIPEGVTEIGMYAFYSNQLTSVVIPEGVTTIHDSTFSHNQLTSIVLPSTVKTIDYEAFWSNKLTSVVIPENVEALGNFAFRDNPLVSVTIKGKSSVSEFTSYGEKFEIDPYPHGGYGPFYPGMQGEDGWLEGSVCRTHSYNHWEDIGQVTGDDTNPCIHWEP